MSYNIFKYKVSDSVESKTSSAVLVTLEGYLTFNDSVNLNNRYYRKGFWKDALNHKNNVRIFELLEKRALFGSLRHPDSTESPLPEFDTVSHAIRHLKVDDVGVYGIIDVLDTPYGNIINTLVKYGAEIGVSTRAYGRQVENNGYFEPVLDEYVIVTWDLVAMPAFTTTYLKPSRVVFEDTGDSVKGSKSSKFSDFPKFIKGVVDCYMNDSVNLDESIKDVSYYKEQVEYYKNLLSMYISNKGVNNSISDNFVKGLVDNLIKSGSGNNKVSSVSEVGGSGVDDSKDRVLDELKVEFEKRVKALDDEKSKLLKYKDISLKYKKSLLKYKKAYLESKSLVDSLNKKISDLTDEIKNQRVKQEAMKDVQGKIKKYKSLVSDLKKRIVEYDKKIRELNQELSKLRANKSSVVVSDSEKWGNRGRAGVYVHSKGIILDENLQSLLYKLLNKK